MKEFSLESEQTVPSAVHARANSSTRQIVEPPKPLPIVAEHPDAAPQRADIVLRMAIHGFALAAIFLFLTYYCLWLPFWGKSTAAFDPAQVISTPIGMPSLPGSPH